MRSFSRLLVFRANANVHIAPFVYCHQFYCFGNKSVMLGLQIYRNRGILRHICQPRHDLDPYPDFFGTAYPDFSPNPIKCGLKNIYRLSRMHPGLSPRDSGRSCGSSRRLRTCLRQLAFGSADMQNTKPSARHRRSADWPWRDAATPSGPDAPTGTNAARDADLGRDERMDDSKIRSDLILEFRRRNLA